MIFVGSCWFDASAQAQTPRYRITPLVKIDFNPNPDLNGTLGINNKGQVVYGYNVGAGVLHAWAWLPTGDYGWPAGFIDLTTESESDAPAIARDLNEDGVIVGQSGGVEPGSGRIAVWKLDSSAVDYEQLGALSATNQWSGAHAINDQSPAVIVGLSAKDAYCACDEEGAIWDLFRPIRLEYDGTNTLVELSVGNDSFGEAQDVNTPAGTNDLLLTGYTECNEGGGSGECRKTPICHPRADAVDWSPSTRNALPDSSSNGSYGRGVNDAEKFAGWRFTDEIECVQRALYWASPSSSEIVLGDFMPSGQGDDGSRAEAINDASPPQVVGWNTFQDLALLWEYPEATTPVVTDLNSSAAVGACSTLWKLYQAHDINDNDWIITWGQNQDDDDLYAVLLTPFPACPVDVVQNGCADVADLLAVIAQWGACQVGTICSADTDANCAVNTADLLAVIAAWGCTPCGSSFVGGGSTPPSLEEVIAIVLSSSIDDELKAEIIEELIANWP